MPLIFHLWPFSAIYILCCVLGIQCTGEPKFKTRGLYIYISINPSKSVIAILTHFESILAPIAKLSGIL